MPHSDSWVAAEYLYAALNVSAVTTLATGGVHRDKAPPNVSTPYVVFRLASPGADLRVVSFTRIWSPSMWDVIAVGTELQADVIDQISAAILSQLHGDTVVNTTSGVMHECSHEFPIFFDEVNDGVNFKYSGGQYLIKAKAT